MRTFWIKSRLITIAIKWSNNKVISNYYKIRDIHYGNNNLKKRTMIMFNNK